MAKNTEQYRMDYFERGSLYSGSVDYKRFSTLDYNMESYIGITGVGIISGWTIEQKDGLNVKILPGKGVINGFAVESPYTYKKRSEMVIPEREVEIVNTSVDRVPEEDLKPDERSQYILVRQAYDISYAPDPEEPIENAYIKAVIPYELALFNNNDNYIYAERDSLNESYPELTDYPALTMTEPSIRDYSSRAEYEIAKQEYNAQIEIIRNYEWRKDPANHFTDVQFRLTLTLTKNSNKILLAKVVTRNGDIQTIDLRSVDSLENMKGKIESLAKDAIQKHNHGGDKPNDPTHVRLETEIRNAVYSKRVGPEKALYLVLSGEKTTASEGHKHDYYIDSNGNGYTVGVTSEYKPHFHYIKNNIISQNEFTVDNITVHFHSLPIDQYILKEDSKFLLYINDVVVGDETDIKFNLESQTVELERLFGEVYSKYSTEFFFTRQTTVSNQITGNTTNQSGVTLGGDTKTELYKFELRSPSLLSFMIDMQIDFDVKFGRAMFDVASKSTVRENQGYTGGPASIGKSVSEALENAPPATGQTESATVSPSVSSLLFIPQGHPFIFMNDEGTGWVGLEYLIEQCIVGEQFLKTVGDTFTFVPKAAQNITVKLEDAPSYVKFDVKLEVLGNTEVTGVLDKRNILYLNASKILLGEFDVERIPFIDHIGRINENCSPFKNYISSKNGIAYKVIPSSTSVDMDHSHNVLVNQAYNGVTQQTFVGEDPVYYGTGKDGISTYMISHIHGITEGKILPSSSNGLTEWQKDLNGLGASYHTHDLIIPYSGDPKTIYSIQENKNGQIYVGTASGLYMIPNEESYLYVINGEQFYMLGDDLWELLLEAKRDYEIRTDVSLTITEEIYLNQIAVAESNLLNEGDSYLMTGVGSPSEGVDEIMIQKLAAFAIPNFKYTSYKYPYEVTSNEIITGVIFKWKSTNEEITDFTLIKPNGTQFEAIPTEDGSASLEDGGTIDNVLTLYKVERYLHDIPIWSIELRDGFSDDIDGEYSDIIGGLPIEDLFVCSSDAIARHRNLEEDFYAEWEFPNIDMNIGGMKKVVKDLDNNIWLPTTNGLFVSRSYENGRIFHYVSVTGFSRDIKDVVYSIDGDIFCATGNSIYKTEDGGKTWVVSKSFASLPMSMIKDEHVGFELMYVTLSNRDIYRSSDKGIIWEHYAVKTKNDSSDIFAFKGKLFISELDGVFSYTNDAKWTKVFDKQAYSFKKSYDGNSFFVGCHNELYKTDDGETFNLVYSFNGLPLPIYINNGSRQNYGYAYNSLSNSLHFKDFTYLGKDVITTVVTNYERFMPEDGPWSDSSDYEIFLDNKMIFSTIDKVDLRGIDIDPFTINAKEGILDFSARTVLKSPVDIYDYGIEVESVDGFSVNDRIVIKTNITPPAFPELNTESTDYATEYAKFQEDVKTYGEIATAISTMIIFATISSISGNYIYLDKRSNIKIDSTKDEPASVYKLPRLEGTNDIWMNIFESKLINKGDKSHETVEDSLSISSDLRPYQLNNSYLSNILQLTQAVRYVYPQIGLEHKNNLYYDFHYTEDELNKHINLLSSEMYSGTVYDSEFIKRGAKSINKIMVGYGNFTGILFVGTDIGIFLQEIAAGLEGNWFYVPALIKPVYDLIIKDGETVVAATDNGLYYSSDLIEWTIDESTLSHFSIYNMNFRWPVKEQIVIPSHSATLSNDSYDWSSESSSESPDEPKFGYIESSTQDYTKLKEYRSIKLINAGDFDGNYNVILVEQNRLTIDKPFTGLTGPVTYNSIEIEQIAWWEKFGILGGADLPNTFVACGLNSIIYKNGDNSWSQGGVPTEINSFMATDIVSLSNGSMLVSALGTVNNVAQNLVLKTTGLGDEWEILFRMEEISGEILSCSKNSNGNTELIVKYKTPEDRLYVDGIFNLNMFGLFLSKKNYTTLLNKSYIIWNYYRNGENHITLSGGWVYDAYRMYDLKQLLFKIYPLQINSMINTQGFEVLFGTNVGICSDRSTVQGFSLGSGIIKRSGITGSVLSVDTQATIVSISSSVISGNVILSLNTDVTVSTNQFEKFTLHITDLEPVPKFTIVKNTVKNSSGEFTMEIKYAYDKFFLNYIGKKTAIVPSQSVLKVTFDTEVELNQFQGGNLYITSNERNNIANSYAIVSNTESSVTVNKGIDPVGTSSGANRFKDKDIISGQKFSMIDSSGKLQLTVGFNEFVKENQFAGKNFVFDSTNYVIHSNSKSMIVLEPYEYPSGYEFQYGLEAPPLDFQVGSSFSMKGETFERLDSFNAKQTSIDLDHYHQLNLIGNIIYGDVININEVGSDSIIDIDIVSGWNDLLILDGSIIDKAIVRFYNPLNDDYSHYVQAKNLTETELTVSTENKNIWDLNSYNSLKISAGWKWEVDATLYGYTESTFYLNFIVYNISVIENIAKGADTIVVQSTVGMVVGDLIEINDGFGTTNTNTIVEIVDINNIRVEKSISSSFFADQNARVKVIRDSFENNHTHQIKRNEVMMTSVADYNSKGYPSIHSHIIVPYIQNVSKIIEYNDDEIIAVGSGSKIFKLESGGIWKQKTDLKNAIGGIEEIDSISTVANYGLNAIAGTSTGFLSYPLVSGGIVNLEKPFV